jgi:hypothetical protein
MTGFPTTIYPDDWPPELPKRADASVEGQTKDDGSLDEQHGHSDVPERAEVCGSTIHELNKPEWINQVKAAWRKSIEGIVETGRLLLLGHASIPPAEFDELVPHEFGFSASMARKLMVIAKDERITNCAIWHKLPRAWTTVYELTKLDNKTFDGMLREGRINSSMNKLVAERAVRFEKQRKGVQLNKLPKLATASSMPEEVLLKRSLPLNHDTAKNFHELLTWLVALMRVTQPDAARAARLFLLPEERQEVAGLASEAITWLSSVLDAISLATSGSEE